MKGHAAGPRGLEISQIRHPAPEKKRTARAWQDAEEIHERQRSACSFEGILVWTGYRRVEVGIKEHVGISFSESRTQTITVSTQRRRCLGSTERNTRTEWDCESRTQQFSVGIVLKEHRITTPKRRQCVPVKLQQNKKENNK